jgi:kumamolisin
VQVRGHPVYAVSTTFGQALRNAHTAIVKVDAYYDGTLLVGDLNIADGAVTVNGGTGVRRTLDVTLTDEGLWDTLDVIGVELKPYRGIRYPDGTEEWVPLGVFQLDAMNIGLAPGGGIQIRSAPDRWVKVQRAMFETPRASVVAHSIRTEALTLASEAVPGVTFTQLATSTRTMAAVVWDRDRDAATIDLATSIGAEVFFDVAGNGLVKDAPLLSATPVWTVDASTEGVMLGGDRVRDRSRTYNVVVLSMSAVDGRTPFAPQTVEDDDPTSRTYTGGAYGRVPFFYSSPLLRSANHALEAGPAILNRVKAVNAQLNVEAIVHPGLDRGDVITVIAPGGVVERHLVDAVTIPLTVGGTQQITTRSSRPEGDVPGDE